MKKNKLKILVCCILSIIIMIPYISVFAEEKNSQNYNFLLKQGYSAEYLGHLTEDSMKRMVDLIGDGYVSNIKIEKSTCNKQARGTINETSLTLQIIAGTICKKNTNQVTGILVGATWEWAKSKPVYRGKDAVTINWDSDYFTYMPESFYAYDGYKTNANDEWIFHKEYTSPAKTNQGGIGHWTDLKGLKKYVGGGMLFLLNPKSYMIEGNKHSTTVNMNYTHTYMPLTGLSFSVAGVGVGVNWNTGCDDLSCSSSFTFS